MAERNTGKKWAKRLLRGLLICGGTVVCAVACCLIYIIATAPKLASVDVTPSSYRTVVTDDGGEAVSSFFEGARHVASADATALDLDQNLVLAARWNIQQFTTHIAYGVQIGGSHFARNGLVFRLTHHVLLCFDQIAQFYYKFEQNESQQR